MTSEQATQINEESKAICNTMTSLLLMVRGIDSSVPTFVHYPNMKDAVDMLIEKRFECSTQLSPLSVKLMDQQTSLIEQ